MLGKRQWIPRSRLSRALTPAKSKSKPSPPPLQRQKKPPQHLNWWHGSGMRKRCLSFQQATREKYFPALKISFPHHYLLQKWGCKKDSVQSFRHNVDIDFKMWRIVEKRISPDGGESAFVENIEYCFHQLSLTIPEDDENFVRDKLLGDSGICG